MKFYDCESAPSPRRVRIFIAEKGLHIETVQVDLQSGEQMGEAFRRINPDCAVPVLETDDGTYISEVTAICQYLEERHPEPSLLGRTAEERALVSMWNTKIEWGGLHGTMEAVRNGFKGFKGRALTGPHDFEQIPELAARGHKRLALFLERMNTHFEGRDYVVGDYYSIADITAFVVIEFAGWLKVTIPEEAMHLRRWYDAVSGRPACKV